MRIQILSVGEIKTPYLKEGGADYLHRLRHCCKIETTFVQAEKIFRNRPKQDVLDKEGKRLLDRIASGSVVVVLDRQGKPWSSEELAKRISSWRDQGTDRVVFIIGGPLGLSANVLKRADVVVSLSSMTFAHEMVKLILLEQLYRAFTILKGEKYHK